jgi:uncharacterized protein
VDTALPDRRRLATAPPAVAGRIGFGLRSQGVCWEWTVPADTELTGPMALRLWVEVSGADDADLFAGVEKWRGHRYIPFEGSYGFGRDRITTGWLKASLRALDETASRPNEPVPACTARQPLAPGQVVQADLALGPSATMFRAGAVVTPGAVVPGGTYGSAASPGGPRYTPRSGVQGHCAGPAGRPH